jgi:hypothetical protein
MLMMPGDGRKLLFVAECDVCTGSSTVDVFALGREELCGLWPSVVSGGRGGLSLGEVTRLGCAVGIAIA